MACVVSLLAARRLYSQPNLAPDVLSSTIYRYQYYHHQYHHYLALPINHSVTTWYTASGCLSTLCDSVCVAWSGVAACFFCCLYLVSLHLLPLLLHLYFSCISCCISCCSLLCFFCLSLSLASLLPSFASLLLCILRCSVLCSDRYYSWLSLC